MSDEFKYFIPTSNNKQTKKTFCLYPQVLSLKIARWMNVRVTKSSLSLFFFSFHKVFWLTLRAELCSMRGCFLRVRFSLKSSLQQRLLLRLPHTEFNSTWRWSQLTTHLQNHQLDRVGWVSISEEHYWCKGEQKVSQHPRSQLLITSIHWFWQISLLWGNKTAKWHKMPLRVETEETKCGMNFVKAQTMRQKKLRED